MSSLKEVADRTKKLKLLYVEDDDALREETLFLLGNFFDVIVACANGQEALEAFHQQAFDIVLSDVRMPHMDGLELVEALRKIDEHLPIMLLSAYNEATYLLKSIELGVDGYILKPLELEHLVNTLERVCEKILLKKENDSYKKYLESEIRSRTSELERKLLFDDLTQLRNRYSFFEDLQNSTLPVLLLIDINQFKIINELYGIDNGSLVLKKFADFLNDFASLRAYSAYRISGDEFILLHKVEEIHIEKYEEDIEDFFSLIKEFKVKIANGEEVSFDVTMGISTSQQNALECAKIALDSAKEKRVDYVMYSSKIDNRADDKEVLLWRDKIKYAIKNSLVRAVFQPIVDENGTVVKHEALMRLQDEDSLDLIAPSSFLDISIKTGLYRFLSKYVIFEALHVAKSSQTQISLNFTYTDIRDKEFLDEIEEYIKSTKELGKHLVFEITESESIESYDQMKKFIARFRKLDVKFAIDDFGSGFSNFEYILEIKPDFLKIDGSLVKDVDSDMNSYILVESIVEFSHKLGIKTIAEYVRSKEIFEILQAMRVDEYQGFYFSKPLMLEETNMERRDEK
jgi:diguanylate cyclase (GGDEF)-like protein